MTTELAPVSRLIREFCRLQKLSVNSLLASRLSRWPLPTTTNRGHDRESGKPGPCCRLRGGPALPPRFPASTAAPRSLAWATALRGNGLVAAESMLLYERGEEIFSMPATTNKSAGKAATERELSPHDYLEATRQFWQPYAKHPLTREDARDMAHNLIGFFTVLREWTIAERQRERCGIARQDQPPRRLGRPRKKVSAKSKISK